MVDQRGVLTLVEAKLTENPEARRKVIGQILDYAAGAVDEWGDGKLKVLASKYWQGQNKDIDDVLRTAFGDIDTDEFREQVEANLNQMQIRLVVAADELRPEARRIIEFLNQQMRTVQVFGLEIRCFGDEPQAVIVPFLVGQSHVARAQKAAGSIGSNLNRWTVPELENAYAKLLDPHKRNRFSQLLLWAVDRKCILSNRKTKTATFGLAGSAGDQILSVSLDWNPDFYLTKGFKTEEERDDMIRDLKSLGLLSEEFEPADVISKRFERALTDLTDEEFSKLLSVLSRYCQGTRAASRA